MVREAHPLDFIILYQPVVGGFRVALIKRGGFVLLKENKSAPISCLKKPS
jgi:hypothetical protein